MTAILTSLDATQNAAGVVELTITLRGGAKDIPVSSTQAEKGHRKVVLTVNDSDQLYKFGAAVTIEGAVIGTAGDSYVEWLRNFIPTGNGGLLATAATATLPGPQDDTDDDEEADDEAETEEAETEEAGEPAPVAPPPAVEAPTGPSKGKKKGKAKQAPAKATPEPAKPAKGKKAKTEPEAIARKAERIATAADKDPVAPPSAASLYDQIDHARTRAAVELIGEATDVSVLARFTGHRSGMLRRAAADRIEKLTGTRPETTKPVEPGFAVAIKVGTVLHHAGRSGAVIDVECLGEGGWKIVAASGSLPMGLKVGAEFATTTTLLRACRGKGVDQPPGTSLQQFFGLEKRRRQA